MVRHNRMNEKRNLQLLIRAAFLRHENQIDAQGKKFRPRDDARVEKLTHN